jgi:adenylate cyclase
VALIHQGAETVRRRLAGEDIEPDFPITRELKALGATDYVAMAMHFSEGRRNFVSWATDRAGGFTDEQIARLAALLPLIAMRFELETSYFTTRTLFSVYLGEGAARKVLDGTIQRAVGETIRAAIWYSDLRGFTAMAERMGSTQVIETLDDYFDCMVSAVHENHGEVLKFIGDGLLAIFPVEGDEGATACANAMAATRLALQRFAALNRRRKQADKDPLRGGIALHVGEVIYGNIGAEDRLDFTAIGPAVNLVSRLEPLCETLDQPVLLSEDFATCSGDGDLVALGAYELRGIPQPQTLFALPPGMVAADEN